MFQPDSRVILLDQLRAPAGYGLEAAVATTFTLQLGAALVPPLAFASHQMRDAVDPIAVLEAVRSTADRIDVFCQAGQIVVPRQASDLMAFLEPMVHPVRAPRPGYLFHPKIWFVRYSTPGQPDVYRLLCLTRNLTDSRAWDAAVVIEGREGDIARTDNEPLAALLRYLPGRAVAPLSPERAARVGEMAERALRVEWSLPAGVRSLHLHSLGVPGVGETVDYTGSRHLVVSPFCNDDGLRRVTGDGSRQAMVVSRPEALDRVSPQWLTSLRLGKGDGSVFVLQTEADPPPERTQEIGVENSRESEPAGAESAGEETLGELTGLHAKITVIEKNRHAHLIVGSANATSAAFEGNVEFLVEMIGSTAELGISTMMGRGGRGDIRFRDLLQQYQPTGESIIGDENAAKLESQLRTLAAEPTSLTVTPVHGDHFDLHMESERSIAIHPGQRLTMSLLTVPGVVQEHSGQAPIDAHFGGVILADVTPFVIVRLQGSDGSNVSTVIHATLIGGPDGRLDAILARQVDTREKFLRFLALVLGLLDPGSFLAGEGSGPGVVGAWGSPGSVRSGVLEPIVSALADKRDSLRSLDGLVERLSKTVEGRSILPEGFDALWANVKQAMVNLEPPA